MSFFNRHLKNVDESYLEHSGHALSFAATLAIAAAACLVHALLPFLFERTGSRLVLRLHDRMVLNRMRRGPGSGTNPGSVRA